MSHFGPFVSLLYIDRSQRKDEFITRMERLHKQQKTGKAIYNIVVQVAANAVCKWLGI